jgi:hypothetical protein
MRETRRTRKICFSEKIAENPYIKRRPVMGRFTRERAEEKHFLPIAGLSHFFRLATVRNSLLILWRLGEASHYPYLMPEKVINMTFYTFISLSFPLIFHIRAIGKPEIAHFT